MGGHAARSAERPHRWLRTRSDFPFSPFTSPARRLPYVQSRSAFRLGESCMRIEFYGLVFDTPQVTFYLWSPWRSAALEHRLFEAVRNLPKVRVETMPDEWRVTLSDPKAFRAALQGVERVLKGWQEEAEMGGERRSWRWLLDGDTDAHGYDHGG